MNDFFSSFYPLEKLQFGSDDTVGRDDLYKSSIVVLHDFSTVKCLFKAYAITYACRIVVLKSVFPEIRVMT